MKKILLGSLVLGSSVLFSACTLKPQADYAVTDTEMVELDPSLIEDGNAAKKSGAPAASVKPALNSDAAKKIDPAMVEKNKELMDEESVVVE